MALFDKDKPEEFLLFVWYFQMIIEASVTLAAGAKFQYIFMLVCGEALCQRDTLSVEVGSTTIEHLNLNILGLGTYFFPVNALPKQKRVMRHIMRKPIGLKVRR